jgi:hypothetical protein
MADPAVNVITRVDPRSAPDNGGNYNETVIWDRSKDGPVEPRKWRCVDEVSFPNALE